MNYPCSREMTGPAGRIGWLALAAGSITLSCANSPLEAIAARDQKQWWRDVTSTIAVAISIHAVSAVLMVAMVS